MRRWHPGVITTIGNRVYNGTKPVAFDKHAFEKVVALKRMLDARNGFVLSLSEATRRAEALRRKAR